MKLSDAAQGKQTANADRSPFVETADAEMPGLEETDEMPQLEETDEMPEFEAIADDEMSQVEEIAHAGNSHPGADGLPDKDRGLGQ